MWTIFKVLTDSYNITSVLHFGFLKVASHVGPQLPDQGLKLHVPCTGRQSLKPWTTKEVPTKFNHFKEDSLALSIFLMLRNHHHYVVPDTSIIPKGNPVPPGSHTPLSFSIPDAGNH